MFKKILFTITNSPSSDKASIAAFEIAKRYNAKLTILNICGIPTRAFSQIVKDDVSGKEINYNEEYAKKLIKQIEENYKYQLKDCNYKVKIKTGLPHREILREIREENFDLIIMGTREEKDRLSAFKRNSTGSTMQAVSKVSKSPVLIIGRDCASLWGGFSNIVFGTDFSKASDNAFKFAYKMAKNLKSPLNIFHAIDTLSDNAFGKNMLEQREIDEKIRNARNKIRKKYISKMEADGFKNYDITVWEGVPYVEIVKYTREIHGDLLVMAHHTKETNPEKAILGSTVEQVVLRVNCPVISLSRNIS